MPWLSGSVYNPGHPGFSAHPQLSEVHLALPKLTLKLSLSLYSLASMLATSPCVQDGKKIFCCNMYVWSVYESILLLAAPLPSNTAYATEWAVKDLLMTMKHWRGLQQLVSTSHAILTQLAIYWFSNILIREIIFVIIVIWFLCFMLGWKKWKQQRRYIPSTLSLTAEPTGNPNIMNLKNHNYLIIVINLHIQI